MGVAGEDGGEMFRGGGVQFLDKSKLKSEIFNEKKSVLTKIFSSANLNLSV